MGPALAREIAISSCPVTVLVVALDDSPKLRGVLIEARAQAAEMEGELLLVLNRAPEAYPRETREALSRACDRLEFEPSPGKSAALNAGVDRAEGEVIAFTDDDTDPPPGWLARLCAPLLDPGRDPLLMATGGPVIPIFEPDTEPWARAFLSDRDQHFIGPKHDLGDRDLDYPVGPPPVSAVPFGANFATRREIFKSIRYDPDLGPSYVTGLRGGEDTLLGHQILRAGFRIRYVASARMHHPVYAERSTLEYAIRAYWDYGRAWVLLLDRLGADLPTRKWLAGRLLDSHRRQLRRKLKRRSKPQVEEQQALWRAEIGGMLHQRLRHPRRFRGAPRT